MLWVRLQAAKAAHAGKRTNPLHRVALPAVTLRFCLPLYIAIDHSPRHCRIVMLWVRLQTATAAHTGKRINPLHRVALPVVTLRFCLP